MLHRPRPSVVGWSGWTAAEHFKLGEQRREETVAANEAASAGNAGAVRAERLMSEHDQQLQIVREDHAQEVSHLQHLAAAAQRATDKRIKALKGEDQLRSCAPANSQCQCPFLFRVHFFFDLNWC